MDPNKLGIGLQPGDATLVVPGVLKERGEFYRRQIFHDDIWKIKGEREELDTNQPENFPLREYVNYLKLRQEKRIQAAALKVPIKRICHEFVAVKEVELKAKKDEVADRRVYDEEKLKLCKEQIVSINKEKKLAVVNDINARNHAVEHQEFMQTIRRSPKRIIRRIPLPSQSQLRPRIHTPSYVLSVTYHDSEDTTGGNFPVEPKRKLKTVFIKIGEELKRVNESEGEQDPDAQTGVNLYQLLKEINESVRIKDESVETKKESKDEFVVLLPKAFGFGDEIPRDMRYDEYTENYTYFRIDPSNIAQFLVDNKVKPDEVVSLKKIRDMLDLLGLPLQTEEEKERYKKMLEKERQRKEKLDEARDKLEEERRQKREEKEKRKDERLKEIQIAEENQRKQLMEKQKMMSEKLNNLSEQKEAERVKQIEEKAAKQLLKEQRAKRREYENQLKGFIQNDILKPIIDASFKIAVKAMGDRVPDKSKFYVTKEPESHGSPASPEKKEVIKCISRGIQSPKHLNSPQAAANVSVGFESAAKKERGRIVVEIGEDIGGEEEEKKTKIGSSVKSVKTQVQPVIKPGIISGKELVSLPRAEAKSILSAHSHRNI